MRPQPQVHLLCDGGPTMGLGHIRRSMVLCRQLEQQGITVSMQALSTPAVHLLPASQEPSDATPVFLFDAPAGIDDAIELARSEGRKVVALDWFGRAEPDVNIAVFAHQPVRARERAYAGLEYVIVREELADPKPAEERGVLVVLGGGDVLGQGHQVARLLARQGWETTLVQGPFAQDRSTGGSYRVLVDPPELPQLLLACEWAVTNGGGCMFEAMCAGKTVVALPQTPAEWRVATAVHERGGLLGLGVEALPAHRSSQFPSVASRAKSLVDGRGARRVAQIVQGML